ncbi:MAG: carbohydrate ABC transporter substrate-binding protein [Christensenellaceae bacterium]|nr:carbohydrate ABC transporter substrate-binding protein [Christensenellaceae bacterium]
MKKLMSLLLTLILILSISTVSVQAQERKTITFWFWGAAPQHQEHINNVLVDWYNNSQDEYELVMEFRNTVDVDIPVALPTGTGPDIVYASGPSYMTVYATEGLVLDISNYAEQYGWKERLLPAMYDACTINGKLYSLPNAILIGGLFYNKELFAEKGWEPPTTMEEMEAIMDQAIADGMYALAAGNKGWKPCNDHFSSMIINHTISPSAFYNALMGIESFDNPEMIKGIAKSAEWYQKGYLSGNDYLNLESVECVQLIKDKRAAMLMAPSLYVQFADNVFSAEEANLFGFTPMPSYFTDEMIYDVSMPCNFGISAATPYPDECAKILDHMMTAEFLKEMTVGWPGYWTVPVKDLSSVDTSDMTGLAKMITDALKVAAPEIDKGLFALHPSTFFPPATDTAFQNIDTVWMGVVSPEAFAADVAKELNAEIEDGLITTIAQPSK